MQIGVRYLLTPSLSAPRPFTGLFLFCKIMKTSVISHGVGTKYIKIYEDFVAICTYLTEVGGKMVERSNTCAAALLGYYEHLHNGRNNTENTNFELALSNAYLEDALFGNYSEKTVREANLLLEELGYITIKRPTKSGVFSKERNKILLNVDVVNTALELAAICQFKPVLSVTISNITQRRKDTISNITQQEKEVAPLRNITDGTLRNITHNNNDNKEYIIDIINTKEEIQTAILVFDNSEQPLTETKNPPTLFETKFDEFRLAAKKAGFDGAGGNKTEWELFKKKHKDWREVVDLLLPALKKNIKLLEDKKKRGEFTPNPPNFSTWMNQRRWERFAEEIGEEEPKSYIEACEKLQRDFEAGKVKEEDLASLVEANRKKFTTGH